MIEIPNVPKGVERWPDGEVILVARPENPQLAVALASIALDHQSLEALQEASSGRLTFMGFLKRQRDGTMRIVDEKGENPQLLQAGDTFLSRHEISDHPPES